MTPATLGICFATSLAAGFVHGVLSFGYAMIAMAILPLFLPYVESAAIVQLALLVLAAQITVSLRGFINWRAVVLPALFLLIGKVLGIVLLMRLDLMLVSLALGVLLIFYAGNNLLGKRELSIRGTPPQGAVIGLVGGLLGGVFNISGPFSYIFFHATSKGNTKECAACINFTFVPAACAGLITHICYGNFTGGMWGLCAVALLGVVIGTFLGLAAFKRMDARKMMKLTYLYVGIMGLVICLSCWIHI